MKAKVVLIGVVALVASFAARAQSPDSSARVVDPKFGTSVTSLLTLPAVSFQLVSGTEGVVDETASRSCASDAKGAPGLANSSERQICMMP